MNTESPIAEDDLEGLGSDDEVFLGEYPIDTVLIRNETRTAYDVLRRIEKGSFVMDPDFQRDFIWPEDKQCKLIESVLMRIPLPVFYLAENTKGQMIVVDGLQRLSTFKRFVDNQLRLRLPNQSELNNKYFKDLSPKLQNRIEDCNLILYIIDSKVPTQALLDIFERVNGGVPLTRQQMRNCLYSGQATRFLKQEAGSDVFLKVTTGSLNKQTMRDRELINRFCAFKVLGPSGYRGDMDDFLAQALACMNDFSNEEMKDISNSFRVSMENNWILFGRHAFRKHTSQTQARSVINASLWDVMSVGLSKYPSSAVEAKKNELQEAFYALIRNPVFDEAITLGTSQVNRVYRRFELANDMLMDIFG